MQDYLKNFKPEDILEWLKEAANFFWKPSAYIADILEKPRKDLVNQYIFYITIYCSVFVLFGIGVSAKEWVKPLLFSLYTSIPTLILFTIVARIYGREYFQKVFFYVLTYQLLFTPIIVLTYATYLSSVDYFYRYIFSFLNGLATLYLVAMLGFAIESNKKLALKISITNYLILNLFYVLITRLNIDPYSKQDFQSIDPIYHEYKSMVEPLDFKEQVPSSRFVVVFNDKINTSFTLQKIMLEATGTGNTETNDAFIKKVNNSLNQLEKNQENIIYERNKRNSQLWIEYLKILKEESEFQIKDTTQLRELNATKVDSLSDPRYGVYILGVDVGRMVQKQIPLKWYHNSTIENHDNTSAISDVFYFTTFFIGHLLDYIYGNFILKEYEPKPYKEIFEPFEQ